MTAPQQQLLDLTLHRKELSARPNATMGLPPDLGVDFNKETSHFPMNSIFETNPNAPNLGNANDAERNKKIECIT